MIKGFQYLDFAYRSYREAFFFIIHPHFLKCNNLSTDSCTSHKNLGTEQKLCKSSQKNTFQFCIPARRCPHRCVPIFRSFPPSERWHVSSHPFWASFNTVSSAIDSRVRRLSDMCAPFYLRRKYTYCTVYESIPPKIDSILPTLLSLVRSKVGIYLSWYLRRYESTKVLSYFRTTSVLTNIVLPYYSTKVFSKVRKYFHIARNYRAPKIIRKYLRR